MDDRALEGADGIEDDLGWGINEWGIPLTPEDEEPAQTPPPPDEGLGLVDLELFPEVGFTFKLPASRTRIITLSAQQI